MNIPLLVVLISFFSYQNLVAQEKSKDSLTVYFKKKQESIEQNYATNNFGKGILVAQELLEEIERKVGKNTVIYAYGLHFLGNMYGKKGELLKVLEYKKKALVLAEKYLDPKDENLPALIHSVGAAYMNTGEWNQGLSYSQKAEHIYVDLYGTANPVLLPVYGALSFAKTIFGDIEEAHEYAKKHMSITLANFPIKSAEYIRSLEIMASYWYMTKGSKKLTEEERRKRMLASLKWQHKVVDAYVDFYGPEHQNTGNAWFNLGAYYKDSKPKTLERMALSRKYSLEGTKIYEKLYNGLNPALSVAYRNIAGTFVGGIPKEDKDYEQSFYYRNKALSAVIPSFKPHPDSIFAVPDFSKPENLICLSNDKVYRVLSTKLSNYKSYADHQKTGDKLLYDGLKLAQAAVFFVEQKMRTVTQKEDYADLLTYLDNFYSHQCYYSTQLYRRTGKKGYLNQAFESSEQTKSVILLQSLKNDDVAEISLLPIEEKEKDHRLKKQIAVVQNKLLFAQQNKNSSKVAMLQDSLYEVNKEYDAYIMHIKEAYPSYFNLQYSHKSVSIAAIQDKLLNDSTMLLELHFDKRNLALFSIYKDTVQIDLIPWNKIKEFVKNIEKKLQPFNDYSLIKGKDKQGKGKNDFAVIANEIYREVLSLNQVLNKPEIKRLVIIPDDVFNYIPFELLLQSKPRAGDDFKDFDYLIKDYTISYAYSASVLIQNLENKKKVRSHHKILGFAASYGKETPIVGLRSKKINNLRKKLVALPGVVAEVKGLQKRFSGDYFFGKDANETNFKKANFEEYAVVHLAMHGLLDQKHAMASSIAFTEDNDSLQDNFMYAYELMNMNIHADLVVLSACETGLGTIKGGEGVMSLARTFAYAGVPSLIMTLWAVNDHSTALIMQSFYKGLSDGLPKDVALRQAKLNYLNKSKGITGHPLFWGPYILVGDVLPIKIYQPMSALLFYGLIAAGLLFVLVFLWRRLRRHKNTAAL